MSSKQCTIPNCHRPGAIRGYCEAHYRRFMRGASEEQMLVPIQERNKQYGLVCTEENCYQVAYSAGLCLEHHRKVKWNKYKDKVNLTRRVKYQKNKDELNAQRRKRYEEDPAFHEARKAQNRAYKAKAKKRKLESIINRMKKATFNSTI